MNRRRTGTALLALAVLAGAAVTWFLLHQPDVERAGAWAGIIGLVGLPLAGFGLWLTVAPTSQPDTRHSRQVNTAHDRGTVIAVQHGNQHVETGNNATNKATPPPAHTPRAQGAQSAEGPERQ